MHAGCESLFTEDEVEQAADEGFDCVSCQPYVVKPVGECQLGRAERGHRCVFIWDSALSCLWFVLLPLAPVAPPELVPVKVKEPGKLQRF